MLSSANYDKITICANVGEFWLDGRIIQPNKGGYLLPFGTFTICKMTDYSL